MLRFDAVGYCTAKAANHTECARELADLLRYGPSYRERQKRHNSNEASIACGCAWLSAASFFSRNNWTGTSGGSGTGGGKRARARTPRKLNKVHRTHTSGAAVGVSFGGGNESGASRK